MAHPSTTLDELLLLPRDERARVALELIRSLDDEPDVDVEAAWADELRRRADEVQAGTADAMSLDEYREHVRLRREARRRP